MLDIGWVELSIIALVTIIVVGPKEIPRVLRTVTQIMRKVRSMASEFQSGIDDLAREAELDDLKKDIQQTASRDFASELENSIDPTGEMTDSVRDIESSLKELPVDSAAPQEKTDEPVQDIAPPAADKPKPAADKPKKAAAKKSTATKKSKSA
ncbi:MAG: Sec-independent protein translocase protein TatB [Alphaproteobacteria bacterium]|nr:Sec-independent protein translocase protein TatB [Alphaproteobacteria bacterium]